MKQIIGQENFEVLCVLKQKIDSIESEQKNLKDSLSNLFEMFQEMLDDLRTIALRNIAHEEYESNYNN